MSGWKQAPRTAVDGPVGVKRVLVGSRELYVDVTHDGKLQQIVMSEHNAARLCGMLAMMLEIELPAKIAKEIKL